MNVQLVQKYAVLLEKKEAGNTLFQTIHQHLHMGLVNSYLCQKENIEDLNEILIFLNVCCELVMKDDRFTDRHVGMMNDLRQLAISLIRDKCRERGKDRGEAEVYNDIYKYSWIPSVERLEKIKKEIREKK